MGTAFLVGLLTLLALDVCQCKAGGEKQGEGSRTIHADTKKLSDQRDQPLELQQKQQICNENGCAAFGGSCFRGNPAGCDEITDPMASCSSGCRCCREDCPADSCGTSQMGTCNTACMDGEFTAGACDESPNCQCCEPCEAGSCNDGRCVAVASDCSSDEYSDGNCGFGSCTCCKTCQASDDCANAGGQCINADATCATGLSPNSQLGCNDDNCQCCVPECTPSSACADGPNPGRCMTNEDSCDATDEYPTDDGCGTGACTCCKTCEPDSRCAHKNGICVNPTQETKRKFFHHNQCPSGYYRYRFATCNTGDCICCVSRHNHG